ncbi:MAG TPA: TIGR03067 domain-containing protein [Urbifossiella sp.]
MKGLIAAVDLVLLFSIGLAADSPKKAPTPTEELQRFQGTWQIQAWEESGQPLAAADLKKRSVFFGGNIFVFRRDGKLHQAGTVQIDSSKSIRTINLSVKDGPGKDGVMLGIYSLESNTLKLCIDPQGQTRPDDFKPAAKSGCTVITLTKPKPPADETIEIAGKYRSELLEATGKLVVTEAVVERRGDAYLVTYTKDDKVLFVGTALRKGDQLSMCWISSGQIGVSVYKIEAGPKLTGEYATLGGIGATGKEVLKPFKKID